MEMSVSLPTEANSWKAAVRAERLGYSHAWFFDTALLNAELFAAMAVALLASKNLRRPIFIKGPYAGSPFPALSILLFPCRIGNCECGG